MKNPRAQAGALRSSRRLAVEVRVREGNVSGADADAGIDSIARDAKSWILKAALLAGVLAIAGIYTRLHIGSGWIPGDEGTLSQSALRVMQGQLPHRDFTEIYTGGLSFFHALAFRVFGVNLMSLRICVFLSFLAWLSAFYYIALRFCSVPGAGAITLLAVAWSYPNYPAAMPSWYNLFFATFGAAALLRYLEERTRRWLFVAGVCGGVSLLIKVIGLYYIAGVFLFLAFLEQNESAGDSGEAGSWKDGWPYRVFSVSALLLFLAIVVDVLHPRLGPAEFYQFVMPSAVVVALILLGERRVRNEARQRFRTMFRLTIPFLGGVAIPVIVFLAPYARSGTIRQFFSGVMSSVATRSIVLGVIRPASVEKSIFALLLVGLVAAAIYWREVQGKIVGATVGLGLTVLLLKASTSSEIVLGVWNSAATLTPLVVLLGAIVVLRAGWRGGSVKPRHEQLVVLLSLSAVCGLVQYPFAAPYYLLYSLPLTLLAAAAIVANAKQQPGTYLLAAVAGFYLLFGVIVLVPSDMYEILVSKVGQRDELRLERGGGLRIEYAANFAELAQFLQQHSPNGLMYAGNDCPELYFLSGLKNVTRDDGGAPAEEVFKALQSDDLKLVVINEAPFYPGARMDLGVRAEVTRRFPHSSQMGIFHVFWRD